MLAPLFDEQAYLELHPDVAAAVAAGHFSSGEHHYAAFGRDEGRALRSRTDASKGRILITGTGRAGTTLLVQLLTALGFDTGFSRDQSLTTVDPVSHAGLEHLLSPHAPLVVKSPWLVDSLSQDLGRPDCRVAFAVVPMRLLAHAAESRRRVSRAAAARGEDPMHAAGGLWLTDEPADQEAILLGQFYKGVWAFVQHEIQPLFIEFPRFAVDKDHLMRSLSPLWETYGVSAGEVTAAFDAVVRAEKINIK